MNVAVLERRNASVKVGRSVATTIRTVVWSGVLCMFALKVRSARTEPALLNANLSAPTNAKVLATDAEEFARVTIVMVVARPVGSANPAPPCTIVGRTERIANCARRVKSARTETVLVFLIAWGKTAVMMVAVVRVEIVIVVLVFQGNALARWKFAITKTMTVTGK